MWMRSLICLVAFGSATVFAQDDQKTESALSEKSNEATPAETARPSDSATRQVEKSAEHLANQTGAEIQKIATSVDRDPRAKTAAAGILQPIYLVAEALAFPAFHWIAFGLMTAGVISYALQLVLGKLAVLMRLGFSLKEILSDIVGLAISLTGLVLTTQAAAENSTFTQSPAAVISATVVGGLLGFILYLWGQSQEIEAAAGRSKPPVVKK